MPWEIDDAIPAFQKIASIKRHLPDDVVFVDTCLNLSSYIIDWNKTQFTKSFFIEKYEYMSKILYELNHSARIYDGPDLYGHLDFQRELRQDNIDHYMSVCPDVYFHPHTLIYMINAAREIKDEYFVITPEIPQLWDSTWDMLVNPAFKHYEYSQCENRNIHEIIYLSENLSGDIFPERLPSLKWAGWCDLYNKAFYEKLVPIPDNWNGYGPWDYFGINVCTIAKSQFKINMEEYVLRNQIIFDKDIGIYQNKKIASPYKKYISLNEIPNQRAIFESNFSKYIQEWALYAQKNNII